MRRSAIQIGLVFAFIFGVALSVSPSLHERFHADAKQAHHQCAVTVLASGSFHHAGTPKVTVPLVSVSQVTRLRALTSVWVPAVFSSSHIFEHAPPAQA
jgi:hypothetical protein